MKKIFAINLGSTSTKVAYYEDEKEIYKDSISHDPEEFKDCPTVFDQFEKRKKTVLDYMNEHQISPDELDAFVTRGGQTKPVRGGVYEINDEYVRQSLSGDYGVHVCSLGSAIALDICKERKALPLTVDTPCTDEFEPLARYSGLKEIERISSFQALNHKAMAKYYARSINKDYRELNLVVVMLGGGITVAAHKKGLMVDGPDGLEGDGPFSNNRCCSVPVGPLVKLCYSGKYDLKAMMKHINGEAGLMAYLGTTDIRAIEKAINEGDKKAEEVLDAMCYQTAKDIGAYATVLKGDVDAILLIGGMANSKFITEHITERVKFIAPVIILPGEREMESLCLSSLEALEGKEEIQQFI
ncbi:MAG: butyrate kinase [Erysipelotrichaceae bacterium]|nr:butyrate kinase [Erysipelotrichaceae bacterium]